MKIRKVFALSVIFFTISTLIISLNINNISTSINKSETKQQNKNLEFESLSKLRDKIVNDSENVITQEFLKEILIKLDGIKASNI